MRHFLGVAIVAVMFSMIVCIHWLCVFVERVVIVGSILSSGAHRNMHRASCATADDVIHTIPTIVHTQTLVGFLIC